MEDTSVKFNDIENVSYGYGLINVRAYINKTLENTENFVSPIDTVGSLCSKVTVYNNTSEAMSGVSIFTAHSNDKMLNLNTIDFELLPKQNKELEYKGDYQMLKHFLWGSLITMSSMVRIR